VVPLILAKPPRTPVAQADPVASRCKCERAGQHSVRCVQRHTDSRWSILCLFWQKCTGLLTTRATCSKNSPSITPDGPVRFGYATRLRCGVCPMSSAGGGGTLLTLRPLPCPQVSPQLGDGLGGQPDPPLPLLSPTNWNREQSTPELAAEAPPLVHCRASCRVVVEAELSLGHVKHLMRGIFTGGFHQSSCFKLPTKAHRCQ
jgi:hypothetical protein